MSRKLLRAFVIGSSLVLVMTLIAQTSRAGMEDEPGTLCKAEAAMGIVENCRRALADDPDNIELRRHIAGGLLVAGDEAGSLAAFESLALERPFDGRAQYDYGVTLVALHQYKHGAEVLSRAIELDPDNLDAQIAASIIFAQIGRKDEAFTALKKAAELGSELAMFELSESYRLGYGTKKDPEKALQWLTRAAEGGHVTAMTKLVATYLDGGYGRPPDQRLADQWARRAHRALRGEPLD